MLPGTTAVWGSVPGAATVMVLMADAHGGDMRLVAFMQFLRVVMVATVASLVSRLVAAPGAPLLLTPDWFPPLPVANFALTLAVAAAGVLIGIKGRIPAGALIVPLFAGTALSGSGLVQFVLPPWLMVGCYVLLGWGIGLRFTLAVAVYAARRLPQVALSVLVLIGLCGGLGYLLHRLAGIDLLTAYLATSPGGADSVAIIATASAVDVPFVMAMQSARFLLILFTGPSLARVVARWMQQPRYRTVRRRAACGMLIRRAATGARSCSSRSRSSPWELPTRTARVASTSMDSAGHRCSRRRESGFSR